ncbi:hypothetical protein BGX34_008890 [Mortierella sp. NVP85]|nr:hypothetical protein BGX34_008890 [Mortierella sp. NVP85]
MHHPKWLLTQKGIRDQHNDLPDYLKSFHDSGISDARLKRFNWLHPRNYSGDGSLSDDYTLSPYGTSVSSPRGDAWEIVDHGPRKSIDELWDEAFEYQQRIRLLEEIRRVQDEAAAAVAATAPTGQAGQAHYSPNLDQIDEEQQEDEDGNGDEKAPGPLSHVGDADPDQRWWSQYGGGSETCHSPSSYKSATGFADILFATTTTTTRTVTRKQRTATLSGDQPQQQQKRTPMTILSGTMTQISRTTVYASRKGVRSDRGSAMRLLHSMFGRTFS